MVYNFVSVIQLLLAQNEKQKSETYVGICVLALLGCIFIIDMFAKESFAKEKALKKTYLFLSFVSIVVFFIFYFYIKKV